MGTFIFIAALILIIYAITKKEKKSNFNYQVSQVDEVFGYTNADIVYNTKGIKRNSIAGMSYRNLKSRHSGYFTGYAIGENNKHDPNAVAIYNKKGKQVGYLPKGVGTKKVKENLKQRPNKMIFVWGKINYNPDTNNFWGHVYTPFGLTDEKIGELEKIKPEVLLSNPDL